MRDWSASFLVLALFLAFNSSLACSLSSDGDASSVIVVLKDDPGYKTKPQLAIHASDDMKVKRRYDSINAFSASVSSEKLKELKSDPRILGVYPDREVHILLSESVPLINASSVWPLIVGGVNITGAGQTVCLLDTGVDYTHPDLGGCGPLSMALTGDVVNVSVESSHPYADFFDFTWTLSEPGFSEIAIHFVNLGLEDGWDYLYVMDENDVVFETFTGTYSDLWSVSVPGDTIKIRLVTDELVTGYGFSADQVVNGSFSASWNCSKVFGGYDFINHDPDPMDDHDHGTHCAGIAAGNGVLKGVAPDAGIVAVKVLDSSGYGGDSDILSGIEYCVEYAEEYNISVISMSLGGGLYGSYCDADLPYYAAAINSALEKNISVVIATGNNHSSAGIAAPACIFNATPVGSTDDGSWGTTADVITSATTNRGVNFPGMLLAPGRWITSCVIGGYDIWSGTSMATPHVAGAFVLLRQYLGLLSQDMSPGEIASLLNSSGKPIFDSGTGLYFSRIDVYSAITSIDAPPQVLVVSPEAFTKDNYSVLNWTCVDPEGANMSYYLYGFNGSAHLLGSSVAESNMSYAFNWTDLSDGPYSWWVVCDDGTYNVSSGNLSFTVDSTAPLLSVISPSNGSVTDFNLIVFNVSFSDLCLETLLFSLNGSSQEIAFSGDSSSFNLSLANGPYTFSFSLNDSAGNLNATGDLSFYVNATPPSVSLIAPNDTFSSSFVNISCMAIDDVFLESITLYWNYSGFWASNGSSMSDLSWFPRTVSGDSFVSWNCLACDNSSNCAFAGENMSFYVDSMSPQIDSNISPGIVVNASNVSFYALASDSHLDSVWASVVFPDLSVLNFSVPNNSSTDFAANMTGFFNVTFFANDSSGNTACSAGSFLSMPPLDFDSSFYGFNSSSINASFRVYFAGSLVYEALNVSCIDAVLPDYVFNLSFSSLNGSFSSMFFSFNLSSNDNLSLGFDRIFNSSYPLIYAVNSSFSFGYASVNLSYAGASYVDNSSLLVFRCSNWSFPDQNCSVPWVGVESENNLDEGFVSLNVSGFSAYSIAQGPYCGDGVKGDGEACDGSDFAGKTCASYGFSRGGLSCSASCSISTGGCYTPTGGGGGSSGGGGGAGMAKLLPSCFDGIKNFHDSLAEEGIDCGGPCSPCMSCFDGIQNQGEDGVDCGGPCGVCATSSTSSSSSTSTRSSTTSSSLPVVETTSSSIIHLDPSPGVSGFDFSAVVVFFFVLSVVFLIVYGCRRF